MKTKRRHELHTNALADWLGKNMDTIRPIVGWIVAGVAAVLVAYVAWSYFSSSSDTELVGGWNTLSMLTVDARQSLQRDDTPGFQDATKGIRQLATDFSGTPLAIFAETSLGDLHLMRGQTLMWTKRPEALESLHQAVAQYNEAATMTEDPLLKNRLLMSLATAQEWMFQVNDAKQAYEKVGDIYRPGAQEQLAAIGLAQRDDLFQRLQQYQPPAASPASKKPGQDFGSPDIDLQKDISGDLLKPFGDREDRPVGTSPLGQPSGADIPPVVQPSGATPAESKK